MVRVYLEDPYAQELDAVVTASRDGWCTLSRTVFFPGGGGQPPDHGTLSLEGEALEVTELREDEDRAIWHRVGRDLAPGTAVQAAIDWPLRRALMRHHGLLHVVNAVARQRHDGVITGAQIGTERPRIDLRLSGFSRDQLADFEARVNEVVLRDLPVTSSTVDEEELRRRPELVRTLDVAPPIVDGRVRVVEIAGFDAQACGGTHVHSTAEIGRARIERFDNKGKDNKRFYWSLDAAAEGR